MKLTLSATSGDIMSSSALLDGMELFRRAQGAQLAARGKELRSDDQFLAVPRVSAPRLADAVGVIPLTGKQHHTITKHLSARVRAFPGERRHESTIRRVLEAQNPSQVTRFTVDSVKSSDTLPGRAPLVDHLAARMEADPDWSPLLVAVRHVRNRRVPSIKKLPSSMEITLGVSTPEEIKEAIKFVTHHIKATKRTFGICQLTGDMEAISVPKGYWADICEAGPEEDVVFRPAASGESGHSFAVRFMVGHLDWELDLRLPIRPDPASGSGLIVRTGGSALPQELGGLVDTFGVLCGIGVANDIAVFNESVSVLFGTKLRFAPPVDLHLLARLAGFNLTRYAVEVLSWICLGGLLPKGECSIGDQRWHQPRAELPAALVAYMSADIGQVAAIAWVLTASWVMTLFPDVHAVIKTSRFRNCKELLEWWHLTAITGLLAGEECPSTTWVPVSDRRKAVSWLSLDRDKEDFFVQTAPDWSSVSAGGCRYFHSARSFLVSILPVLREKDLDAWPELYREQLFLVVFGRREILPLPSSTSPCFSAQLLPNPEVGHILKGPARSVSVATLKEVAKPGICTRGLVLEYIRTNPGEGAPLLARLEQDKGAARYILPFDKKVNGIVADIRLMLGSFGKLPERPEGWVDPYPPAEVKTKVLAIAKIASNTITSQGLKAKATLERISALRVAVKDCEKSPPEVLDHNWNLSNLLNVRKLGDPSMDEVVHRRMGAGVGASLKRQRSVGPEGERDLTPSTRPAGSATREVLAAVQPEEPPIALASRDDHPYRDTESVSSNGSVVGKAKRIHLVDYLKRQRVSETEEMDTSESGYGPAPRPSAAAAAFIRVPRRLPGISPRLGMRLGPPVNNKGEPQQLDLDGFQVQPRENAQLSVPITHILVIGNEQARRMSCALVVVVPHIQVTYLSLSGPEDYVSVSAELKKMRPASSIIILWPFDETAFLQAESGLPLEVSAYDRTTHCVGPLGVVSRPEFLSMCDQSKQILAYCQRAVGSILFTPLVRYVGASCCELRTHCVGMSRMETAEGLGASLQNLTEAAQRWASEEGFSTTRVLCPHLEILRELSVHPWSGWVSALKSLFNNDPIHLSREGYAALASAVWTRIEDRYSIRSDDSVAGSYSIVGKAPTDAGRWSQHEQNHHTRDLSIPRKNPVKRLKGGDSDESRWSSGHY